MIGEWRLTLNKLGRNRQGEISMTETQQEIAALLESLRSSGMPLMAERLQDLARGIEDVLASTEVPPACFDPGQRFVS